MNKRFHNALQRIVQPTPPIWMMRQAGRYHQHYQHLRKKYSFIELCKTPDLAAETALGPIRDFDFDVAILFSDLLFPLEALGMGLTYDPAPRLGWHLTSQTVTNLKPLALALPALEFQRQALQATRALLPNDKSLIGFVGSPWTLFTYAVEGAHKGSLAQAKTKRSLFRQFSERIVPLLVANIELQLAGGAEIVMIFDTAAGELSADEYRRSTAEDLNHLAIKFPGQLGYYSKGTLPEHYMCLSSDFAGFGVDHRWSLSERLLQNKNGFMQGNFDQALLFADDLRPLLGDFVAPLKDMSPEHLAGWVCGLGHGVLPQTPERNVRLFVDTIREAFR